MDTHVSHISTGHDNFPNFAANHTAHSAQSGNWNDPDTWDNAKIPNSTDIVVIKEGHSILLDDDAEAGILGLAGELLVEERAQANITLRIGTFVIYDTGRFEVGNPNSPYMGNFTLLIMNRPIDFLTDPLQYGTGILVFGEFTTYGKSKTAFVKATEEPRAGDTTLVLAQSPQGWEIGDRLVIPDTRQWPIIKIGSTLPPILQTMQTEEVTIASISGNIITLMSPLQFDHLGFLEEDGTLFGMPDIANITRNITFRSENPVGTRGHGMFTERANIHIKAVSFVNMGRTTAAPLGSFNQIGRYPVHFHHLMGPINPENTGYQFEFTNCVVEDGRKWSVAVHNSHWGKITDNVFYKAQGSGFVLEQGNERANEIERNIAIAIGNPLTTLYNPTYGGVRDNFKDIAWEGSGFWMSSNESIYRNNIAAACAFAGHMYNGRGAGGFAHNSPILPKFRGADHNNLAHWDDYKKQGYKPAPSIIECDNNESYCCHNAIWIGFSGDTGLVKNTRGWNIRSFGIYSARNAQTYYDGLHLRANAEISNLGGYATKGIDIPATSYQSGMLHFKNISVKGFNIGIHLPMNTSPSSLLTWPNIVYGPHVYENVDLQNNVNIIERVPTVAKETIMRGVKFALNSYGVKKPGSTPPLPTTPLNIMEEWPSAAVNTHTTLKSRLSIYPVGETPYEFFMLQQAPEFIMPERYYPKTVRDPMQNCPTTGLTNAQCMLQHNVATLGNVAIGAITKPNIRGFVRYL